MIFIFFVLFNFFSKFQKWSCSIFNNWEKTVYFEQFKFKFTKGTSEYQFKETPSVHPLYCHTRLTIVLWKKMQEQYIIFSPFHVRKIEYIITQCVSNVILDLIELFQIITTLRKSVLTCCSFFNFIFSVSYTDNTLPFYFKFPT